MKYTVLYLKNLGKRVDIMQKQIFTNDELRILSEGIFSLMKNTDDAIKMIKNREVIKVLEKVNETYKELNCKICSMIQ